MTKSIFSLAVFGVVVAFGIVAVSAAWGQIPPGYEIVHITDNPNDYSGRPQINNCGEVVFSTRINQVDSREEIFLYDNGKLTRLTHDNIRDAWSDINDDGTIVWTRQAGDYDENHIVMRSRDGEMSTVGFGSGPKVNNLGHVAWKLFTTVPCAWRSDIFLYDGETIQQITDDGLSNQVVRINNADQLVWTRYDICANPEGQDIMLYSDGVITQLTDGQLRPAGPRMNDVGQITWSSRDHHDSHRIVELWEDGVTVTVIDPGEGAAGINIAGDIVFLREAPNGDGNQIWLYRDGELLQITDNPFPNFEAEINDEAEIVWQAWSFPESDIYLLRRVRTGEADFDGDIDLDDFGVFQDCMTGPGDYDHLCTCRFGDLDHDRDVDLGDYAIFQTAFTGEASR